MQYSSVFLISITSFSISGGNPTDKRFNRFTLLSKWFTEPCEIIIVVHLCSVKPIQKNIYIGESLVYNDLYLGGMDYGN